MRVFTVEKLFTLLFAAFAIFVIWKSYNYGIFSSTITGAGFFPVIAGVIMLASTLSSLLSKFKTNESRAIDQKNSEETDDSVSRTELIRVALLVSLSVLFIVLAPHLGMVILTPFYIFACFLTLTPDFKPVRLGIGILTAILFTFVAWAVFDKALGVPLPRGLF